MLTEILKFYLGVITRLKLCLPTAKVISLTVFTDQKLAQCTRIKLKLFGGQGEGVKFEIEVEDKQARIKSMVRNSALIINPLTLPRDIYNEVSSFRDELFPSMQILSQPSSQPRFVYTTLARYSDWKFTILKFMGGKKVHGIAVERELQRKAKFQRDGYNEPLSLGLCHSRQTWPNPNFAFATCPPRLLSVSIDVRLDRVISILRIGFHQFYFFHYFKTWYFYSSFVKKIKC